MNRRWLWLFPLLGCGPAFGQGIDLTQGGPIQVTARDGLEWRQAEQMVTAKGDAKAVRANATVTADRLIAWYRRKGEDAGPRPDALAASRKGGEAASRNGGEAAPRNGGEAAPRLEPAGLATAPTTEGNEVYRLRAEGNVHVFTLTDHAWGDQATYDLDQGVLVMTGKALKLTTPNDTLTARDTLEYWAQKRMAVARGNAVVLTNDARRIAADTLVAYTAEPGAAAPKPQPSADGMAEIAGKLERVEAFNNVSIRTPTDYVIGDRGVYVPDSGIARLAGHVRITHGANQVNGAEAVVNMKTGIATLLSGPDARVTGLIIPNDTSAPVPGAEPPRKPTAEPLKKTAAEPLKKPAAEPLIKPAAEPPKNSAAGTQP